MGSVNAGQTVTVHEREVSVSGWTGTGYMVISPNGDGAFLIGGGGNGGFLKNIKIKLQFWIGIYMGWAKNHPMISKALGGMIGLIVGTLVKLYQIISSCKSLSGAIAIVSLWIIWNVAILLVMVGIAGLGAGFLIMWSLTFLEGYIEYIMLDRLKDIYCSLFGRKKYQYV